MERVEYGRIQPDLGCRGLRLNVRPAAAGLETTRIRTLILPFMEPLPKVMGTRPQQADSRNLEPEAYRPANLPNAGAGEKAPKSWSLQTGRGTWAICAWN